MERAIGVVILLAVVGLVVWAIVRGRRGYRNVQSLMARVDASAAAAAESHAVAGARSDVGGIHVNLSGSGSGGTLGERELRAALERLVDRHGLAGTAELLRGEIAGADALDRFFGGGDDGADDYDYDYAYDDDDDDSAGVVWLDGRGAGGGVGLGGDRHDVRPGADRRSAGGPLR